MMRTRGILTALIVLAAGMSWGQEDVPWPPDPEAIFAQGVEVIGANPIVDNQSRVIHVYRDRAWRSYPYLYQFVDINQDGFSSPTVLKDGSIVLDVNERIRDDLVEARIWILNPFTGEFSRFPTLCGEEPFYRLWWQAVANAQWTYYIADAERYHLCNIQTGKLSPALPDWTDWWGGSDSIIERSHQPVASPDGEYIIFFGSGFLACSMNTSDTLVVAYEISTQRFINLGIGCGHDTAYVHAWLNDTQAIVYTGDMPSTFQRGCSLVDVTQEESLNGIIASDGFEVGPRYYEDPPRFERLWIPAEEMNRHEYPVPRGPCRLTIAYVVGLEYAEQELGNDCVQMIRLEDGTYFYRDTQPDSGELAAVVHFDPQTTQHTPVVSGEIEWIRSISPNGRFALVFTDDNGRLDEDTSTYYHLDWHGMTHPQFAIYDLSTGMRVYRVDADETFEYNIYSRWVSDDILLLSFPSDSAGIARIVLLRDGKAIESVIDNAIALSPGGWNLLSDNRLLVSDDENIPEVYDLITKRTVSVLRAQIPTYQIQTYTGESLSDLIFIHVCEPGADASSHCARFTIRLPQPASQQPKANRHALLP